MSEHDHDTVPLRTRTVAHIPADEDVFIAIDHVYLPEGQAGTCCHGDCGKPAHDPGLIGLLIDDSEDVAHALLSPELALLIANRLTRAANLVLESEEQPPDMEREAARYGSPEQEKLQ